MALLELTGDTGTHDPTIVKEKGIYYRFQTGDGLPFHTSMDLHDWKPCSRVFTENPLWTSQMVPGSTSFWAPEVVFRDGWWRVYYSVSTFGSNVSSIGLVRSRTLDIFSPEYGWEDLGPVISSSQKCDFNCIDPCVASDGTRDWLLFGSFWGGLKMAPLDSEGFLENESMSPVTVASRRTDPNPVEGGFIFPHGGLFYLFASHDFCCRGTASTYHIVVGVSEKISGPYHDGIGVDMLSGGGSVLRDGLSYGRWAGPGHNSVFRDDDGRVWLVYHAYDRTDSGKPKLQIEEMHFDEGWPVFAG